jgi:hypothetical protein
MTGPEHYREAEKLLDEANAEPAGSEMERYQLDAAQVHATLALTAATALNWKPRSTHGARWRRVLGVRLQSLEDHQEPAQ